MTDIENNGEFAFSGVVTPLVLPLRPNQSPDFESLERLLEFQITSRVDAFWLNGTSGEFYALRPEERVEVIRAAKGCVKGRARIIAHVGQASTRLVIEHAEQVLEVGVDALAVIPPYYIPHSQTELIDHFRTISQALSQGIFLYHVPLMCKNSLSYENIFKLAAEGIFIGLKDSAADLNSFAELARKTTSLHLNFCCLNGNSPALGTGFLAGAHGFAGAVANLIPARCKTTHEAARRGDLEEVEASQALVSRLFQTLNNCPGKSSFAWLSKWVMRELGVIRHDTAFQPYDRLDSDGEGYMKTNLMPLVREAMSEVGVRSKVI